MVDLNDIAASLRTRWKTSRIFYILSEGISRPWYVYYYGYRNLWTCGRPSMHMHMSDRV